MGKIKSWVIIMSMRRASYQGTNENSTKHATGLLTITSILKNGIKLKYVSDKKTVYDYNWSILSAVKCITHNLYKLLWECIFRIGTHLVRFQVTGVNKNLYYNKVNEIWSYTSFYIIISLHFNSFHLLPELSVCISGFITVNDLNVKETSVYNIATFLKI